KNYVRKYEKANEKPSLIVGNKPGGNWCSLVSKLYIPIRTVYRWLDPSNDVPDKSGGYREEIIKEENL
ncbi:MAG: hypothetical protein MHPSP_003618, partial [Paramarteilia canceri]